MTVSVFTKLLLPILSAAGWREKLEVVGTADYTAADVLEKLLTVDGSGSGLDADLLDGSQGAAYAKLTGATFTGSVNLVAAQPQVTFYDSDVTNLVTAVYHNGFAFVIASDLTNVQAGSQIIFQIDGAGVAALYGGGGLVVGSPTGGNKGPGSINGVTLYENDNRVATLAGPTFSGIVSVGNHTLNGSGTVTLRQSGNAPLLVDRQTNDGAVIGIQQDGATEGIISVSGTTVTYGGGHLSRWSQWGDGHAPASVPLRGTVISNLDQKCVWIAERWFEHEEHFETVEAKRVSSAVRHELYDGALRPGDTYLDDHGQPHKIVQEDNEQLNCVKVSDTDMDRDFGGILDTIDDDGDLVVATRGEFLVRIAAGVSVQRGDMLVSAGDGTARPLDPDTPMTARLLAAVIGKVMTTEITEAYPDGSYLVPVLL